MAMRKLFAGMMVCMLMFEAVASKEEIEEWLKSIEVIPASSNDDVSSAK